MSAEKGASHVSRGGEYPPSEASCEAGAMRGEVRSGEPWPRVKLGEVCDIQLGKMLDAKKNKGTLRKYLANIDVRWGQFDLSNLKEMRVEDDEIDRYMLGFGDIVMCEGGEPGRCAIWKDQVEGMVYQKALHRIRTHVCLDNRFAYYWFLRFGQLGGFIGLTTGATIKHLPKDKLTRLEIPLPPLPLQRRIADILSAYDDKIANNRRRMELLEESARLVYRKMFGDGTAGTSGTKWDVKRIEEICETVGGGTPKTSIAEYWDGDVPWVVPTDITRNTGIPLLATERKITKLGLQKSSAKMLPPRTILMTSRASIGYFGVCDYAVCTNQGFISIIPSAENMRWYLLYNLLSRVEEIRGYAKGATFAEISKTQFRGMEIVVPDEVALNEFAAFAEDVYQQTLRLSRQNAKLASARDILLPKLMNGRLRIDATACRGKKETP